MDPSSNTTDYRVLWKARTTELSPEKIASLDALIRKAIAQGFPSVIVEDTPADVEAMVRWALSHGLGVQRPQVEPACPLPQTGFPPQFGLATAKLSWE